MFKSMDLRPVHTSTSRVGTAKDVHPNTVCRDGSRTHKIETKDTGRVSTLRLYSDFGRGFTTLRIEDGTTTGVPCNPV